MKIHTPFEIPDGYCRVWVLGIEGREIWLVAMGGKGVAYCERVKVEGQGELSAVGESRVLEWLAKSVSELREELGGDGVI